MTQVQMAPHSIWPYLPTLLRAGLALVLGIFVGLERERRGKDAGVRTFGFAALLGCLGSMLGQGYALLSLGLLGVLIVFLNWQRIRTNDTAELTTSIALLVTGFTGVLCGLGHTFTPVAVAITTAALLAWKEPLKDFSLGLTEEELRSAILLALLTFVIYPVLPVKPLDPWGLIEPRTAWTTVILVAGIGFVNYILWKRYGAKGVELTGFLGGLVNSTVVVTELASRVGETGEGLANAAYRGVMLATAAMLLRNAVLLGILAPRVLAYSAVPLLLMLLACVGSAFLLNTSASAGMADTPALKMTSPFSLSAALKFGALFLALSIAGTLAQRFLGSLGFYTVSFVGGLVSSASSVTSAGVLASHGRIGPAVAGNGVVLAAIASALVNWPLVARIGKQKSLTGRLGLALGLVMVLGIVGSLAQTIILPHLSHIHMESRLQPAMALPNYNTCLFVMALTQTKNPVYKPTIHKALQYLEKEQFDENKGIQPSNPMNAGFLISWRNFRTSVARRAAPPTDAFSSLPRPVSLYANGKMCPCRSFVCRIVRVNEAGELF